MIQTIPYPTSKTAEIMSRYRPIAPKPETQNSDTNNNNPNMDHHLENNPNIQKSPYLRSVWAHLQARPTRTRKRGRTASFPPPPPPSLKRARTAQPINTPPAQNLAMHGFSIVPLNCSLDAAVATLAETVALPLLRPVLVDLNTTTTSPSPIKELDFMPQLKEPVKPTVISPHPVRPIGSTVTVQSIQSIASDALVIGAEEVEREVEEKEVPTIVSDSLNKVRLTNGAYKEMVGQPECCWLDCVAREGTRGKRKRIGGEVVLRGFGEMEMRRMGVNGGGFTCKVRIEWECVDGEKKCVEAFGRGVKLVCEGKDYRFMWRFYSNDQEACAMGINSTIIHV